MKRQLFFMFLFVIMMLLGVNAQAGPFASDLMLTGSVKYDTSFALADNTSLFGGSFSKTVVGVSTSSSFDETGVVGANPQSGTLTNLGDGFSISAYVADSQESELKMGIDLRLDITNTSAIIPYWITFDLVFYNFVNTGGNPAILESKFNLFDSANNEIFFTEMICNSILGDKNNRASTNTFGVSQIDSGTFSFKTLLWPGDSSFYDGSLTIEGDSTFMVTSYFNGNFCANLTVADVQAVPIPGAVLLGGIGLAMASWRFKKN